MNPGGASRRFVKVLAAVLVFAAVTAGVLGARHARRSRDAAAELDAIRRTLELGDRYPVDLAPDLRQALFKRAPELGDGGLDVVTVKDGVPVAALPAPPAFLLTWSPTGREVAFVTKPDEGVYAYVPQFWGIDDKPPRKVPGEPIETADHLMRWSPDGQRLAFFWYTSPRPGVNQVRIVDARTVTVTVALQVNRFSSAAWSPDSRWLAITSPDLLGEVVLVDVATAPADQPGAAKLRRVSLPAGNEAIHSSWSPDGSRLLLTVRAPDEELPRLAELHLATGKLENRLALSTTPTHPAYLDAAGVTAAIHLDERGSKRLARANLRTGELTMLGPYMGETTFLRADADGRDLFVLRAEPAGVKAIERWRGERGEDRTVIARDRSAMNLDPILPEAIDVPADDGTPLRTLVWNARPAAGATPGAVIFVTGPGYVLRPTSDPLLNRYLVERGTTVVLANVRGSIGFGESFARQRDRRARAADVATVARWVRNRLGTSTARVVATGMSAGAMTVADAVAFAPDQFHGAVLVSLPDAPPLRAPAHPSPTIVAVHPEKDALTEGRAREVVTALAGPPTTWVTLPAEGHIPRRPSSFARIGAELLRLINE